MVVKHRRVASLQRYLAAYGTGGEGRSAREALAKRVGTTLAYLIHLGYGFRTASPKLAADIERHTHGQVRVEELRPDIDWAYLARRVAPSAHIIAKGAA